MNKVGQIIKGARIEKNISIEKISIDLRISRHVLEKFEKDEELKDYDNVFYLGHLRSYCSFLELDQTEIVKQFKGTHITVEELNLEIKRPVDEKSFLFRIFNGSVYILEIHHFGKLVKYEFCESIHEAWVPEIEAIDLSEESQIKGFKLFKRLLNKTEKINGFKITDERHEIFSKPEFRSLLLRILNSSKYLSIK